MTTTMSIRELSRSTNVIDDYDYIDIEDKKSHKYKGVIIPAKYADGVKKYLENQLKKERQKRAEGILQFAGILSGQTKNMSSQEIKAQKIAEID